MPLHADRGEHTRTVSASVNPYPVGAKLDLGGDAVTMHNNTTVISPVGQEFLADPHEVGWALPVQSDTRADASVAVQIIA
jgi:hypothetical protein